MAEDLDLVLLGQLLEDVGEPLVVERGDHGGAPLDGQVVDDVGGVGGAHLVQRRDQVRGALGLLAQGQPDHVAPLHHVGLAAPAQALGRLLDGDPAQHPVAVAGLLHAHVVHRAGDAGARHAHRAVEDLAHHQGLGGALLEAAHVEQPGRVDLPAVDVGHPGHRHEDPAPAEDLGHQPEHPGLAPPRSAAPRRGRAPCRPGRPWGRRSAARPGGPRRCATAWCSRRHTLPGRDAGPRRGVRVRERRLLGDPASCPATRSILPCRRRAGGALLVQHRPAAAPQTASRPRWSPPSSRSCCSPSRARCWPWRVPWAGPAPDPAGPPPPDPAVRRPPRSGPVPTPPCPPRPGAPRRVLPGELVQRPGRRTHPRRGHPSPLRRGLVADAVGGAAAALGGRLGRGSAGARATPVRHLPPGGARLGRLPRGAAHPALPGQLRGLGPPAPGGSWPGRTIDIPYFHGRAKPMPYVLLRHRATGRRVWFANFHNPADVRGPAARWRREAVARETGLVNRLAARGPAGGHDRRHERPRHVLLPRRRPDAAARGERRVAARSVPAAGGHGDRLDPRLAAGRLHPPPGGARGLVARTTDHPFVWAAASVGGGPSR